MIQIKLGTQVISCCSASMHFLQGTDLLFFLCLICMLEETCKCILVGFHIWENEQRKAEQIQGKRADFFWCVLYEKHPLFPQLQNGECGVVTVTLGLIQKLPRNVSCFSLVGSNISALVTNLSLTVLK